MSQTCNRCQRVVQRACQSDTETEDCPQFYPTPQWGDAPCRYGHVACAMVKGGACLDEYLSNHPEED